MGTYVRPFLTICGICLLFGSYIILSPTRETWELVGPSQAIVLNQLTDQVTQKNLQSCCQNEIDVVYTWVNGSDPEFQTSLKNEIALWGKNNVSGGAAKAARFYDWNTMRYSIRSVEKFMPFVRNLYIVTNGHAPHWLNTTNPKVHLVTHAEIFPNKSHLPTFNSNAIEHHLHRIKGLSDKFLYLNDDVFLSNNISRDVLFYGNSGQWIYTDFKVKDCYPGCRIDRTNNGKCNLACNNTFCNFDGYDCVFKNKQITKMSLEQSKSKSGAWMSSLAFTNGILSEKFGVAKRYYISHTPHFLDKHIMADYTKAFAKYIEETSASKFRKPRNVALAMAYFNFIMGMSDQGQLHDEQGRYRFKTRSGYGERFVEFVGINSNPTTVNRNLKRWSKNRRPFAFLQDGTGGKSPNFTQSQKVLDDYLQKMFPTPSQFEISS